MIVNFPLEVLDAIIPFLSRNDIKSLSQTSKALHHICTRVLWGVICVEPVVERGERPHKLCHKPLDACAYALRLATGSSPIHQTRTLVFRRDLRCEDIYHCPHSSDETPHDVAGRRLVEDITDSAKKVIDALREDQLLEFRWDLGICFPDDAIQLLAKRQPQLESLSVITDLLCQNECGEIDLTGFRHLKSISWSSPFFDHLYPISRLLHVNSQHLERLEIDLVEWSHLQFYQLNAGSYRRWRRPLGLINETLLGLQNTRTPNTPPTTTPKIPSVPLFPKLTVLSFSEMNLSQGTILDAINIGNLTSLRLRSCRHWSWFLEQLMDSGAPINLKTLEIRFCEDILDKLNWDTLRSFLANFQGLRELFLGVTTKTHYPEPEAEAIPIWDAISNHRSTLKRLVYHERKFDDFLMGLNWHPQRRRFRANNFHDVLDLSSSGITCEDLLSTNPEVNPFLGFGNLECLALGCPPTIMRSVLSPFIQTKTLRFVHLRQTGSHSHRHGAWAIDGRKTSNVFPPNGEVIHTDKLNDMLDDEFRRFLDWIFGPEGIVSLEIVAFGDFSYSRNGRALHNLFVCRTSRASGYQVYDARDKENEMKWREAANRYRNVLEACPAASLWERWGPDLYSF